MNENTETTNVVEAGAEQETTETAKTYTQEELEAAIQREADRRVSQALQKQEKKNAEKVREAEKLARMNEQEKFQYELEQREKAIIEKERALSLAENKNEAGKILAEKGLSLSLVNFVVAEDAETMKENIKTLEQAFKQSVKAEVEKRLASPTPRRNLPPDDVMTKEKFAQLSLSKQQEIYMNNPDLYKTLTQ